MIWLRLTCMWILCLIGIWANASCTYTCQRSSDCPTDVCINGQCVESIRPLPCDPSQDDECPSSGDDDDDDDDDYDPLNDDSAECASGTTDSNGDDLAGSCVSHIEPNMAAACDPGFADSNGPDPFGICVRAEEGAIILCAAGYIDSNGPDAGGTCVDRTSNLVVNPGLEDPLLPPWVAESGVFERTLDAKSGGEASLRVGRSTTIGPSWGHQMVTQRMSAYPIGSTGTLSVRARNSSNSSPGVWCGGGLTFNLQTGEKIENNFSVLSTTWESYSVPIRVPPEWVDAEVWAWCDQGGVMFVDRWSVTLP